jgi:hypothetical protein
VVEDRDEERYLTLPVSEFENLHESVRILRLRIEKLETELTHRVGWEERAVKAEAQVERLRAENARLGKQHVDEQEQRP